MSLRYFDTHSHSCYSLKPPAILHTLLVSTQPNDFVSVTTLNSASPQCLYSIGVHPWYAHEVKLDTLKEIKSHLEKFNYVAIGEIGLDYYGDYKHTKEIQLAWFEAQLQLAQEYDLVVSIHARKSLNDVYRLLKKYPVKFILHGFNGSLEQAKTFMLLNGLFGVNGLVCNPNAHKLHHLVKNIPMENIVLETDYPYVKNQLGSPILIDEVAACVSKITGQSLLEVTETTFITASQLFRSQNEPIV